MTSEDPAVSDVPYAGALRRDVNLLAIFRGVSFLGDALALVALYLRVAPRGHAWAVAALGVASALPLVLFAPVAGLVVDRVRAKPLLISLGAGETLVCAGLGYWHSVPATIALIFALNAVVAFSMPGYSALVVAITGTEHVTRAQGVLQGTQGAASVLGPVLGGLLVGATGQSWPLYVDAISFALGTVGTMLITHDRRPDPSTRGGVREDMMAGVRLVARDEVLRPVTLNVCFFLLALGMVNVAEVFYVTVSFHGSALAYGALGATFGLGTIVGAIYASRWKKSEDFLARALGGAIVLVGLFITAIGFVANVGQIYPFMIATGVAVGVANVAATTLFALRSPEAVRGRVFAALSAGTTSAQVGATVIGGAVLAVITPRDVYRVGGGLATLSALVFGYLALRARRRFVAFAQGD
ncbi:MAG: MFS transporter [Acidobacteriota bacterium]|nr:MFS transporter [Acidobacteriota bacterium]